MSATPDEHRPSPVTRALEAAYGPAVARLAAPDRAAVPTALPVAVDAYRGEGLWHLATVGLAVVRAGDGAASAPLGHELTVATPAAERPPEWAFTLLLGAARTSVAVGRPFHAGARLAPGPPLDGRESGLVALGLRADPVASPAEEGASVDQGAGAGTTSDADAAPDPHGVVVLQAVGVTGGEYLLMQRVGTLVVLERLALRDPLLRTDPSRA